MINRAPSRASSDKIFCGSSTSLLPAACRCSLVSPLIAVRCLSRRRPPSSSCRTSGNLRRRSDSTRRVLTAVLGRDRAYRESRGDNKAGRAGVHALCEELLGEEHDAEPDQRGAGETFGSWVAPVRGSIRSAVAASRAWLALLRGIGSDRLASMGREVTDGLEFDLDRLPARFDELGPLIRRWACGEMRSAALGRGALPARADRGAAPAPRRRAPR
jgi:hypothetical protein